MQQSKKITTSNKLELTEAMLAEMERTAMGDGVPVKSELTYARLQQVLTIKALEKFLKTYGIDLPVSVDYIGGYGSNEQQ